MRVLVYDTWQSLPNSPSESGVYVVLDVFKFTTTVTELLEQGAASVTAFTENDELVDFRRQTGSTVGGEHRHLDKDEMDICNSPSFVAERSEQYLDEPVGLLSDNGAKAVHAVPTDVPLYLGSTTNAAAVAEGVSNHNPEQVHLVCAGSHGDPAYEDLAGASLIKSHLSGESTLSLTKRLLKRVCETSRWVQRHGDKSRYHKEDVSRALRTNESDVVPVREEDYQFVSCNTE